jgi:D-alanyl-D-alanine carboxypeptidase/D-alanyl-D-alanine-endopeptidase (penicillin-binding protein 4)
MIRIVLFSLTTLFALPSNIQKEIEILFDSSEAGGKLGLSVYSLKEKKHLIQKNAYDAFRPASTLKLLVTAAAVDTFPLNWRPQTEMILKGRQIGSTFRGSVLLKGGGDPNISGRYFGEALEAFDHWGESLYKEGIDTIYGQIELDLNYFKGGQKPITWKKEFFDKWYGAEISALSFNDNCIQVRISPGVLEGDSAVVEFYPKVPSLKINNKVITSKGSRRRIRFGLEERENTLLLKGKIGAEALTHFLTIPIRNPQSYFADAFVEAMRLHGIYVVKEKVELNPPHFANYNFNTAPFLSLLDEINQRSQNLHAEILLRHLGEQYYQQGSLQAGIKAEYDFLNRIGIDTSKIILLDGSGLSYGNRVTPNMMTQLMKHMANHRNSEHYIESLAQSGVSSSKKSRLKNLPYPQFVRYKTGFVNFTQGLAGYLFTATGDTLCMALYMNGYKISDWDARILMDSIWTKLVKHYDRERPLQAKAREDWLSLQSLPFDSLKNKNVEPRLYDRMNQASTLLIGRAYLGGATGEGLFGRLAKKPRIQPDSLDCVTFIEYVMALSYAKNENEVYPTLQNIRYLDSTHTFDTRKHFFVEDWVKHTPEWIKLKRFPGDSTDVRISNKEKFYGFYKETSPHASIQTELSFLPIQKSIKRFDKEWNGPKEAFGIGFVGKLSWLWVTHTGIVFAEPGKRPIIRHASSKEKKVVEMDLTEYLRSRQNSIVGSMFFEFKEF